MPWTLSVLTLVIASWETRDTNELLSITFSSLALLVALWVSVKTQVALWMAAKKAVSIRSDEDEHSTVRKNSIGKDDSSRPV